MPYLLRHAHAGDKRAWTGPDLERPLSTTGWRESHGLLTRLRDYHITRIVSSPAVRCLQTVEPLAERRGLTPDASEVLGVGGDPAALLRLLLDPRADDTLVCSHGELIGTVLRHLVAEKLEADSWPKGSTWVLKVVEGQLRDSHTCLRFVSRTPAPITISGFAVKVGERIYDPFGVKVTDTSAVTGAFAANERHFKSENSISRLDSRTAEGPPTRRV